MPVAKFKRTKIVATVGPSTDSYELILALIKTGANAIRLNFSHGDYNEREQQIKWIRKAALEYGKPVAIIQDLQGPKIRLGDFDGVIPVQKGQELTFKLDADYEKEKIIPTQYDLSKKVGRGQRLYLFDGKVKTTVTNVSKGVVHARVENDGILIKRKGINLPDTDFAGDTITDKDKKDLAFGSTQDIDYVAQSFVQASRDMQNMRTIMTGLGMNAKSIVKFETKAAVETSDENGGEGDVIMTAGGTRTVKRPAESVALVPRKI